MTFASEGLVIYGFLMFTTNLTNSKPNASKAGRPAPVTFPRRMVMAVLASLVMGLAMSTAADARIGGGGSFGSRGSRTFSMPSTTPTAPRISPFERSATPNFGSSPSSFSRSSPGLFGGGFGRGLIGGFLGAGLFGMLFGGGFLGGLGGGMSLIGLLLQLSLLYLGFRLIMGFFANRRPQSAFGGSSAYFGTPLNGGAPQTSQSYSRGSPRTVPIDIGPADYEAFEHRLAESQSAYSNGDLGALQRIATPEMAGNFQQELADNDRHGVVNKISGVHLLQGDLSEAWRENETDYATVAMRFSLIDATVEKASGRVVAGNPDQPQEVTEVWTFRRPAGGGAAAWALAGIQQAG